MLFLTYQDVHLSCWDPEGFSWCSGEEVFEVREVRDSFNLSDDIHAISVDLMHLSVIILDAEVITLCLLLGVLIPYNSEIVCHLLAFKARHFGPPMGAQGCITAIIKEQNCLLFSCLASPSESLSKLFGC